MVNDYQVPFTFTGNLKRVLVRIGDVRLSPEEGLDEAKAEGWTVVDMKTDWNRVFAFERR
jgi:hypothetical protein